MGHVAPGAHERLQREARASATGHPDLVQACRLFEVKGHTFDTVELVDGASPRDRPRDGPRLAHDEVVALARGRAF